MKTVAMVPIKLNSERVKEKNLRPFSDGKPLVQFILEALVKSSRVDEVYVYCSSERIKDYLIDGVKFLKRPEYLDGNGCNCNDIIREFMKEVDADYYVVSHATAPFTKTESIDRVVAALERHEAVGVAVPSTDTVWEVHPDLNSEFGIRNSEYVIPRFVARIPERRLMWRAQTPQAFRLPLIRDAYQRALQDPMFQATDDCGVVRKYMPGTKIAVVEGSEKNMKITYKEDLIS